MRFFVLCIDIAGLLDDNSIYKHFYDLKGEVCVKFIHLSDLHIGKIVNEYSMIDDQEYIIYQILKIIDDEKPNAVLIAGDVYDKTQPSTRAVNLLDDFIYKLSTRNLKTFIISGNHDSADRLAFGSRLMSKSNVFMSRAYDGKVDMHTVNDEFGNVNFYLLPFIKPINVRTFFEDEEINSYTDAINVAINSMNVNENERNVILSHQFVTGAIRSDSEDISVGGTDNVDASVYDAFDYVALGHIHAPQKVKKDTIRYSGTPLKYSFSECKHNKTLTVVELKEKGNVEIKEISLIPKRDMVEIKGKYDELMLKDYYKNLNHENDYYHIILTDEEDILDAISKLRTVYHNIMKLDYDNTRTRANHTINGSDDVENKTPMELFEELYELQNGVNMTDEQSDFVSELMNKVWEDA